MLRRSHRLEFDKLDLLDMAPKKRQRTNNVKQDSFIPRTMDEVTDVQRQLRDWVVKAYELRHGGGEKHPFPLDDGGSFLDICRRCWDDKKELLQASVTLVEKVGLMAPGSTVDDFQKKYCLQERGKKRLNVAVDNSISQVLNTFSKQVSQDDE